MVEKSLKPSPITKGRKNDMKYRNPESGVTLVEVLATLVILSFIFTLIYNTFFNGTLTSNKIESTSLLQQEANSLIFAIQKQHEKGMNYTIEISSTADKVTIKDSNSQIVFSKNNFIYDITIDSAKVTNTPMKIEPLSINKEIEVVVTIINNEKYSGNSNKEKYEIKRVISRL